MTVYQMTALRSAVSDILAAEDTHHDPESIEFGIRDGVPVAYYLTPAGGGMLPLIVGDQTFAVVSRYGTATV